MTILFAILCFLYAPALIWLLIGALKLKKFKAPALLPKTAFSILIPFRNESKNLRPLLESLLAQKYPTELFEIILIDDDSHDNSLKVIQEFKSNQPATRNLKIRVIQNNRSSLSPKKDAITSAILEAQNDWILCTDADGTVPGKWLQLYDVFIQKNQPTMVCAPVIYPMGNDLLSQFQLLDGLSLQLVTMGGFGWKQPLICNGANMGYLKQAFFEVNGYQGNEHVASGDDIFLLGKFRNHYPNGVHFLKHRDAAVETQAEGSWKDIITQRIRWASKTSRQSIGASKLLGMIIFLGNFAFITALVVIWLQMQAYPLFLGILGIKLVLDLTLLIVAGNYLNKSIPLFAYLISSILYPFVSVWVVVQSFSGNYHWKGRAFKK